MVLTDDLKLASKQFDPDIIFILNLSKRVLQSIPESIGQCSNLVYLNLRNNQIGEVNHLQGLKSLRSVDLSNNCISRLTKTSFIELPGLQFLSLAANPILNVRAVSEGLASVSRSLTHLRFMDPDGNNACPLCQLDSYKFSVLSVLPTLEILDSNRLKSANSMESFNALAADVEAQFNKGLDIPRQVVQEAIVSMRGPWLDQAMLTVPPALIPPMTISNSN